MEEKLFRTEEDITDILQKYSSMVRRICFMYLHHKTDVEDVFQDVFLKLLLKENTFESDEHIKAWLCRITINQCKDHCKSFWQKKVSSIDEIVVPFEDKMENELMQVILSLPQKYKDVIYLFYYEDYAVPQMAKLLNQKENTIYSNLCRARKLLKQMLGGTSYDFTY
jgi:RNA polymerase sigma factor (sigma-70 family)